MSEEAAQLRLKLEEARQELQAAQTRITIFESQLSKTESPLNFNVINQYQNAFDHLLEGCQVIGFDWRYLYVNDSAARYARQEKEALIGHGLLEKFPGIEESEVYALLNRCMTERLAQDSEIQWIYSDNSTAWFAMRIQPVSEGIFLLTQDITERKQGEIKLRKLYRTLSVLSDTNQAIVRIRHRLPELFQTVCDIAVRNGGFIAAWVADVSPDRTQLASVAGAAQSASEFSGFQIKLAHEEPFRRSAQFEAVHSGHRVVINDVQHDTWLAPMWRDTILQRGANAVVTYPLKVEGIVRSVFSLSSAEANYFDADELRLLDEMAGDLMFAMEYAEQEEQRQQAERALQRSAKRLEVLHTIDRALLRADSIRSVIDSTLKELRKLLPCQRAGVVLFDEATDEAALYMLDTETETELVSGQRTPMPSSNWLAAFNAAGIHNVGDLRAVSAPYGFYRIAAKEGLISILHVLLTAQDKPIGLLNLLADTPNFFTPEYEEIAIEIGGQLAIAIRQMYLTQTIERHTAELESKVAERTVQLRAENERIQAILNYSLEGIIFLQADFSIVQMNTAFRKLIGHEADTKTPGSLLDILHMDDRARFMQTVDKAIADHRGRRFEIRLIKPDRSSINVEVGLQNITADGFVCSFHDIGDRQRAEQALRIALEAEKQTSILKSRFVSMASHEFRTPLAGILASTETLTLYRQRMKEEDISDRLGNIRRQVNHMTAIIEDVLQLGRMQSGRVEYHPTRYDINALSREVAGEFQIRPETSGRIFYVAPEVPIWTRIDVGLIRQSINNLISNALKYSPSPKPVHVNLSCDASYVTLQIKDEGIGIPEKDLPTLFEPFNRASNVGNISGTGLGLCITKQAVEQHGGTIAVDSQVDVGTTFTVTLPLGDEQH